MSFPADSSSVRRTREWIPAQLYQVALRMGAHPGGLLPFRRLIDALKAGVDTEDFEQGTERTLLGLATLLGWNFGDLTRFLAARSPSLDEVFAASTFAAGWKPWERPEGNALLLDAQQWARDNGLRPNYFSIATASFPGRLPQSAEALIEAVDSVGLERLPEVVTLAHRTGREPAGIADSARGIGLTTAALFEVSLGSGKDYADLAAFAHSAGDTVRNDKGEVDPARITAGYPGWEDRVREHLELSANEPIAEVFAYLREKGRSFAELLAMPPDDAREVIRPIRGRLAHLVWTRWAKPTGLTAEEITGDLTEFRSLDYGRMLAVADELRVSRTSVPLLADFHRKVGQLPEGIPDVAGRLNRPAEEVLELAFANWMPPRALESFRNYLTGSGRLGAIDTRIEKLSSTLGWTRREVVRYLDERRVTPEELERLSAEDESVRRWAADNGLPPDYLADAGPEFADLRQNPRFDRLALRNMVEAAGSGDRKTILRLRRVLGRLPENLFSIAEEAEMRPRDLFVASVKLVEDPEDITAFVLSTPALARDRDGMVSLKAVVRQYPKWAERQRERLHLRGHRSIALAFDYLFDPKDRRIPSRTFADLDAIIDDDDARFELAPIRAELDYNATRSARTAHYEAEFKKFGYADFAGDVREVNQENYDPRRPDRNPPCAPALVMTANTFKAREEGSPRIFKAPATGVPVPTAWLEGATGARYEPMPGGYDAVIAFMESRPLGTRGAVMTAEGAVGHTLFVVHNAKTGLVDFFDADGTSPNLRGSDVKVWFALHENTRAGEFFPLPAPEHAARRPFGPDAADPRPDWVAGRPARDALRRLRGMSRRARDDREDREDREDGKTRWRTHRFMTTR